MNLSNTALDLEYVFIDVFGFYSFCQFSVLIFSLCSADEELVSGRKHWASVKSRNDPISYRFLNVCHAFVAPGLMFYSQLTEPQTKTSLSPEKFD